MSNFTQIVRAAANGELTITGSGQAVGRLRIIWNESYTRRDGTQVEEVNTLDLYAFGRNAKTLATRVTGEQLHIQGNLKVRTNVSDKFQRVGGEPGVTFTNVSVDVTRGNIQFLTTQEQRAQLIERHGENPNAVEAEQPSEDDAAAAVEAALAESLGS